MMTKTGHEQAKQHFKILLEVLLQKLKSTSSQEALAEAIVSGGRICAEMAKEGLVALDGAQELLGQGDLRSLDVFPEERNAIERYYALTFMQLVTTYCNLEREQFDELGDLPKHVKWSESNIELGIYCSIFVAALLDVLRSP